VLQLAYAFAKPVVGTRVGGLPEVIQHGRSGFLVEPGDVERLAGALNSLLENPPRCAEMGAYALQLSETRYSWHVIAEATRRIYEGCPSPCLVS